MWSRYNYFFQSEKYGHLLYNSLSNCFCKIDDAIIDDIVKLRSDPANYDISKNLPLYFKLQKHRVLLTKDEEDRLLRNIKLTRRAHAFHNNTLGLTIAPTLECNFQCSYCYEKTTSTAKMSPAIENSAIGFIKKFMPLKKLFITWFGGEPLLVFDIITRLTGEIEKLDVPLNANLITNAYLLDNTIVSQLEKLHIESIQVTLDGPEEIHDQRRVHKENINTFNTILSNIDNLADNWNGLCLIRVNIDSSNKQYFGSFYKFLKQRYKNKNILIYPGIVREMERVNPDINCQFKDNDEMDFILEQYKKHGITDLIKSPQIQQSVCLATNRNGFVIGPEGEMYKCWCDLGRNDWIIGDITDEKIQNIDLYSRYLVGVDPFDDPQCLNCFFLPICNGGCPNLRLRKKYLGEDVEYCINLKNGLPEFLESMYEKLLGKQKHN